MTRSTEQVMMTTTEQVMMTTTEQAMMTTTEQVMMTTTEQVMMTTTEQAMMTTTEQVMMTTSTRNLPTLQVSQRIISFGGSDSPCLHTTHTITSVSAATEEVDKKISKDSSSVCYTRLLKILTTSSVPYLLPRVLTVKYFSMF